MAASRDDIDALLKQAAGLSGASAAEAFLRAARAQRSDDAVGAFRSLEHAQAALAQGPADPRKVAEVQLELGVVCERELGRLEEAIAHYQRAFKTDLNNVAAIEAGRGLYRSLGDSAMVARLYEVELDVTADPKRRGELLLELGRWLAEKVQDLPSAAARLEEAVKLHPADDGVQAELAGVYAHPDFPPVGDGTVAPRRAVELLLGLAERSRRGGDDEAELGYLRRAIGVDPAAGAAARGIETILQRRGDKEELGKLYRTVEGISRRLIKLSTLAEEAGNRDEAMSACFEALGDPDQAVEAQGRLERLLEATGDFAGLAALREQAVGGEEPRERADKYVVLAGLYTKAGQPLAAIERLEAAVQADSSHAEALALLEKELGARKEHGRFARTLEALAADASPEENGARLAALAEHLEKKVGDVGAALEAWTRAQEAGEERAAAEVRRLTAKIDRWDGLLELLAKELDKAADVAAKVDVWRRTAQVYRERHDVETAADLYETVLEAKPDDPVVLRALADLWEREGDYAKVTVVLKRQLATPLQKVEKLNLLRRLANIAEERLEDPQGVVWACREVLRELPGDRESLKRVAATCEKMGDQDGLLEALEAHAAAAATPAEKVPLLMRAAGIFEQRKDWAGAGERLEKALKLQASDATTEALARCYEASERWADLSLLLERGLSRPEVAGAAKRESPADGWRRYARIVGGKLHDRARAERAWKEVAKRLPRDREAIDALTAMARETVKGAKAASEREAATALSELLARRMEIADDPEEVRALGMERAELIEGRLADRAGAIAVMEKLLAEVAPRHAGLHEALRGRYLAAGDVARAVRMAERELFLTEGEEGRLGIAQAIAQAWFGTDTRRAAEAYERVLVLAPGNPGALLALSDLYEQLAEWRRLIGVLELRLEGAAGEEALGLLASLSEVCERHLGDARAAFAYRKLGWELAPGDETLAALDRVGSEHGLWEELIAIYASIGGLDQRRQVADICERELKDPKRALGVLIDALELDPQGYVLLSEIERLAMAAGMPRALLEVYDQLLEEHKDRAVKLDLIGRRSKVRETSGDKEGALVDRLRQYSMAPDDAEVLAEVRRIAAMTGRWEDLLTVESDRFARAPVAARVGIAREAAKLAETKIGDRLRAFRGYLAAFALAPDDPEVLADLWRLAPLVGPIPDTVRARPKLSEMVRAKGPREPTLELDASELMTEEPPAPVVIRSTRPVRSDETMQLGSDDLELVPEDDTEQTPKVEAPGGKPPPMPAGRRPPSTPKEAQHTAWDELERAYMALPARDDDERVQQLLAVARAWELGAGSVERAFETLGKAFRLEPDGTTARLELERLAKVNGAWDRLVQILDQVIDETGSGERAIRLSLDAADVRERTGSGTDAEERYHKILGMKPDCVEALERLENTYRASSRHAELAALLERRCSGLLERLPPGEERLGKLSELGRTYEAMGSAYEAIDAWARLLAEDDESLEALRAHARLFEQVGQWSRVIDALTRIGDHAGEQESRAARRRKAEILETQLELPERAMEAYAAVDDDEARLALERLYAKHKKPRELEQLLRRRCQAAQGRPEELGPLLERRAVLLGSELHDYEGAARCLKELMEIRPEDDAVAAGLDDALGRSGQFAPQAEVLKRRIDAAGRRGAAPRVRAELLIRLGSLQAGPLGDAPTAQKSLQGALALVPDDPGAIAELARLREGGSDWLGYAAARLREAEVAGDAAHAARALVDAARVQIEKLGDEAAAQATLAKALERDPSNMAALGLASSLYRRWRDDPAADALSLRELQALPPEANARRAQLESDLGGSALRRGEEAMARGHFQAAIAADREHLPAVHGLADLAEKAERWDEVEALLADAAEREGLPPKPAAGLWRRVASARERMGRADDAYGALVEADRLAPGDLFTKRLLGENRYRAGRWREAAQHLAQVAEHAEAPSLGREAAEAAHHAALAELKQRRPERAEPLYRRAIEIAPDFLPALTALAEIAMDRGDLAEAAGLFERRAEVTVEPGERAALFEALGELAQKELADPARARTAYRKAAEAAGSGASEALLVRRLELAKEANDIEEAAGLAEKLLERAVEPAARAKRLREAAGLAASVGRVEVARERLREALDLDPHDEEAVALLSSLLVAAEQDEAAAQLLTRTLALLAPPVAERRVARAVLWRRLGEARERLRDQKGAMAAYERALEANPSQRELRELVLARYTGEGGNAEAARQHLAVLIADDPLHAPSLRALALLESKRGYDERARRLIELLAVSGAATDDELKALRKTAPAQPSDEPYKGALEDSDHTLLAHPDARILGEVFATLWEVASSRAPSLEALGVKAEDRTSPVSDLDVAKAFGACARALGNRRTGLYVKHDEAFAKVLLMAQPPTAIVVGRELAEGRATPSLRFLLGRALEIARPEYVLAAGLQPDEFTRLFGTILRAFHPRHARRADLAEDVAKWKRELPYKVARRLSELLREHSETEFSSALWRRAVQHTGNRAGLLVCGDLMAAASILRAEGDEPAIRELARFAASETCAQLQAKVDGRVEL